jgi:hypothetical protein
LIGAGIANTGVFGWETTGPAVDGNAWIRIDARDYTGAMTSDYSDGGFSIVGGTLAAPEDHRVGAFGVRALTPNPVRTMASLEFENPARMPILVGILDVQGREVSTPVRRVYEAGRHLERINLGGLRSGLYFVRLTSPVGSVSRKIVVLR